MSAFSTTDPIAGVYTVGVDTGSFKLKVRQTGPKSVKLYDPKDLLIGKQVKCTSFTAIEVFDGGDNCDLTVSYRFSGVTSSRASVKAVYSLHCPNGLLKTTEFKGKLKRGSL